MTHQEEQYVHFASCLENLERAWRILHEIKQSQRNSLVGPAFQMALIEYAKPYRTTHGVAQTSKGNCVRYKLDAKHVPPVRLDLHNRLLRARDQVHAHSDLTVKEAKLYVGRTSTGTRAFIVQNVLYGAEELPQIDLIIELIEGTLDSMRLEAESMEATLTPSS